MKSNPITLTATAAAAALLAVALLAPHAARAASGMDGGFGYTWRDNADGAVRDTMTLFEMGYDEEVGPADDFVVGPIDLNLTNDFPFYGRLYSQIWISDNGWISFVDPAGDSAPVPSAIVDAAAGPPEMIAPFWSDLELRAGNLIRYGYTGPTLDAFRLQVAAWDKTLSQPMGYDLLLFPDGRIKFQYAVALSDVNETSSSVGIESVAETDGIGIVSDGSRLPDVDLVGGTVIEFLPPPVLPALCGSLPEVGCSTVSDTSGGGGRPPLFYYPTCNPFRWPAEGAVHTFSLAEPSDVDITLSGAGELSLFLLNECSEQSCLEGATDTATPYTLISRTLSAGDYQVSVDGPSAASDGAYTLDVACSPVASPLACGDPAAGTTVGEPSRFDSYPCATGVDLSGPEAIYSIDLATRSNISVDVTSGGADLDVLVLQPTAGDLDPASCIAWGDDGTTAWDAEPGQYLVVVDGVAGAADSFDITTSCFVGLDCSSPVGTVDFATGRVQDIAGDSTGGVDDVQTYACDETTAYTGPEEVWEVLLDQPGQVAVFQTGGTPDLNYFFVSACNEGACVGGGATPCATQLDAGTYYLVVDSATGASGPYELQLIYEETFNRWSVCEDPVDPTTLEDTSSPFWNLSDNAFCISDPMSKNYPDGCTFAMYVTVPCGTSFNLPFYDTEGGHVRVFDLFNGEYVDLVARSPTWSAAGDDITWQDEDCEAGSDPRWNEVVTNVSFTDDGGLCGVYRLEFINHSGNVWELYANCDGSATPGFDIADSLCVALASYQPRPNVSLVSATGDYDCPDLTVTYTIENNGCAPAEDFPVALKDSGTDVHVDTIPRLEPGETVTRSFTTAFPAEPTGRVTLEADPDGTVVQCSAASACDPSRRVELLNLPGCAGSCNVVADAFADPAMRCEDDDTTITIDASGSSASLCASGTLEYRLQDGATVVRDWQPEPLFAGLDPLVPTDYDVFVRCVGEPDCEDFERIPVDVHLRPLMDASSVTARDLASCNVGIELTWAPATWRGRTGSGSYNIYRSTDPGCDAATMEQVIIGLSSTTYTDVDLAGAETYYYVVEAEDGSPASSCLPQGPANRGAVTRVAVEAGTCSGVFDSVTARPELLPRVGTSLRLGGFNEVGGFRRYGPTYVEMDYEITPPLDLTEDEHVHVLRSESPMRTSFTLAHPETPREVDGGFEDFDADHPDGLDVHVFHYLVVVADACENVNPDDFFESSP